MTSMAAIAVTVIGALWIAMSAVAFALFFLLAPYTGAAGAAALTAVVFLVLVAILGLIVSRRVDAAKRNVLMAGLASSGAANLVLGIISKRPLLSLGIGGALAAFFLRGTGSGK